MLVYIGGNYLWIFLLYQRFESKNDSMLDFKGQVDVHIIMV